MDSGSVVHIAERVTLLFTSIFTIYKLFLEKRKQDIAIDETKIALLKELEELESDKMRRLLEDYRMIVANQKELQGIINEQKVLIERERALLAKYRKRVIYLERVLREENIPFQPFDYDHGI